MTSWIVQNKLTTIDYYTLLSSMFCTNWELALMGRGFAHTLWGHFGKGRNLWGSSGSRTLENWCNLLPTIRKEWNSCQLLQSYDFIDMKRTLSGFMYHVILYLMQKRFINLSVVSLHKFHFDTIFVSWNPCC